MRGLEGERACKRVGWSHIAVLRGRVGRRMGGCVRVGEREERGQDRVGGVGGVECNQVGWGRQDWGGISLG